ncbi:acetyl-CoA carboxylase biotin carboxyl carrier protein subunit [uncultured Algibacter sp.]|uniref:acetyl-CoA carboxylase biotin carboxyl carrier protein subunit n=1 Tax=uncultured Algibacter sp. TaxID=298659 RepID=UPI0026213DE6|nr:acetyl-CoA carboxylase biotin carboxyl carrier protein subunit [uncultured Algibacter sp.]
MSKNFNACVNNSFDFEITTADLSKIDSLKLTDSKHHILSDNKSYNTEVIATDFNKKSYKVKVNNNTYNVNIFNELDVLIKKMGFSVGSTKQVNFIKAPMPGLILEINIKVGQEVKENDPLLILEAMKMENIITSPRDGIIKSIDAKKGDAVEKNQLLINFE